MSIVTGISISGKTAMSAASPALLDVIGTPLASAFLVRYGAKRWECYGPCLKHLIPVAILTLFISVLGHSWVVPIVTLMGAAGGAFWSTPYVLVESLQEFCA